MKGSAGKPTVVHLTPYAAPHSGSFVPMIRAAWRGCVAEGWRFEAVFAPEAADRAWHADLSDHGLTTHLVPAGSKPAATRWLTARLAEWSRPVILHTHFTSWDLPAVIATAGRADAVTVWHLHTRLMDETLVKLRNVVRFGAFGRLAAQILCVGPDVLAKAEARLAPRDRTILFPNGVDTSIHTRIDPAERERARVQLDVGDRPVLLLFGWDWELKGGPLLLETVAELRRRGHDPVALVVGSAEQARFHASRAGLEDALRTSEPAPDARPLFAAADVFVSASVAEGLPFSVLEALSSELPVVASDIPGHRLIAEHVPKCSIAARRPESFADAVETALGLGPESPPTESSRAGVIAAFSLDSWTERLVSIYYSLLTEH